MRNTETQQPHPPRPADDEGRILATLRRQARPADNRPAQELQVSLKTYQNRAYVSLRIFEQAPDRSWQPIKGRPVTVRIGELEDVIDALREAKSLTQEQERPLDNDRPRYVPPRTTRPQPRDPQRPGPGYPTPQSSPKPFNEFN